MTTKKRAPVDEARGRKFIMLMEERYNFRLLSVRQAEQVLTMAEELTAWMRRRIASRGPNQP